MKVGLNMLLYASLISREHVAQLKTVKKAGADGVEIPVMEGDVAHYKKLGKILDDVGLERTSCMVIPDPSQSPTSDDPKCRQAAVDYMKELIERSHAVGATVMCGPMFQAIGHFTGQGPTEVEKKRVIAMLRVVADDAKQAGVLLAVEPINRFEAYVLNTTADGAELVRKVGHPSVGLLYDTFHENLEDKDPIGSIRKYRDVIKHFHVSANDRGTPGQDHIDWKSTFSALRAIKYDRWLVVESFGRALPGLAAATKIWRDLFNSNEQMTKDSIAFVRKQWKAAGRK
jgi:D-psicose/D-tagatose/L-ribulose 3-epimerase